MITATRRWLRRHRTKFAIGFGVVGVGYLAGQYVISKISEARERMVNDRIAKDNLKRRFQQNQEDCTITVLELLPTATDNILGALPAEQISKEIQEKNAKRARRSTTTPDAAPSDFSSGSPSINDEDGRSMSSFQSESYVHASQMAASSSSSAEKPARTKVQLWNDLKITSISRTFTLIYTLTLLTLLTRIQLNLLGRKTYLASVAALASQSGQDPTISLENHDDDDLERAYGGDFEVNRKYLTFSWWLLHRGWREILSSVDGAVRQYFGPIKPSEEVSLERLSSLILDVRRTVEGASPEERRIRQWLPYVMPPQDQEDFILRESGVTSPPFPTSPPPPPPIQDPASLPSPPASPPHQPSATASPPLRHLIDETSDLIDSPLFTHVLTLLLDTNFSRLTDQKIRSEAYKSPPQPADTTFDNAGIEDLDSDPSSLSTKLASIMAVMTREAHAIGLGVPNEYVQAMDGVGELEGFAAVVYSGNLDMEAPLGETDGLLLGDQSRVSLETSGYEGPVPGKAAVSSSDQSIGGVMGAASGVAGAAWSGFESVWGRVAGSS